MWYGLGEGDCPFNVVALSCVAWLMWPCESNI